MIPRDRQVGILEVYLYEIVSLADQILQIDQRFHLEGDVDDILIQVAESRTGLQPPSFFVTAKIRLWKPVSLDVGSISFFCNRFAISCSIMCTCSCVICHWVSGGL